MRHVGLSATDLLASLLRGTAVRHHRLVYSSSLRDRLFSSEGSSSCEQKTAFKSTTDAMRSSRE